MNSGYQYFKVRELPLEGARKTKRHQIVSLRGDVLGTIEWYGAWRQFCLFPRSAGMTVWSLGCLKAVGDAIEHIKAERKAETRE